MPSNPEKRREQQRQRRQKRDEAPRSPNEAPGDPVSFEAPGEAPRSVKPRDEAPNKPKRKGANFPKRCPECGYAHERHCSPELIQMFRERMADGRDLIDAETRAVLREHVR